MINTNDYTETVIKLRDKALKSKNKKEIVDYLEKYTDVLLKIGLSEIIFWMSIKKSVEGIKNIENKEELISFYSTMVHLSLLETCSVCENIEFSYNSNFCKICGSKRDKSWMEVE